MKPEIKLFFDFENESDLFKTGVYTIEHLLKPNVFYVGSARTIGNARKDSNGFYQRWRCHISVLKRGVHPCKKLQNTVYELGVSGLKFKIIDFYEPDFCLSAEDFWINALQSHIFGYNTFPQAQSNKGICRSKECKARIGDANKFSNKYTRAVYQFNVDGDFIREWESSAIIEDELGLSQQNIRSSCWGVTNKSYGFIWLYDKNEISERIIKLKNKGLKTWKTRRQKSSCL